MPRRPPPPGPLEEVTLLDAVDQTSDDSATGIAGLEALNPVEVMHHQQMPLAGAEPLECELPGWPWP